MSFRPFPILDTNRTSVPHFYWESNRCDGKSVQYAFSISLPLHPKGANSMKLSELYEALHALISERVPT
jgi:hypothetical protein